MEVDKWKYQTTISTQQFPLKHFQYYLLLPPTLHYEEFQASERANSFLLFHASSLPWDTKVVELKTQCIS